MCYLTLNDLEQTLEVNMSIEVRIAL